VVELVAAYPLQTERCLQQLEVVVVVVVVGAYQRFEHKELMPSAVDHHRSRN